MEIIKLINEKIMFLSILVTLFVAAGCVDTEGKAPWGVLAILFVIMITSMIAYYHMESEEGKDNE